MHFRKSEQKDVGIKVKIYRIDTLPDCISFQETITKPT